MNIPIYQIDAFAEQPFQGNPAAVCPLEFWLPDETLQAIAAENNLSETAFFVEEEEVIHLRWFTPTNEVDLCGHATLAAARVLFDHSYKNLSEVAFNSKSGPLRVLKEGEFLTLDFPTQAGSICDTPAQLIEGLGIPPKECYKAMDYMAVYESEEEVISLSPNFQKLKQLDLCGVTVTAPGNNCDFVSRFFAPSFGINEDAVTGSAHCTLTPFWAERLNKRTMHAQQLSKRTGKLLCSLDNDRVYISGQSIIYLQGTIEVNTSV